MANHNKNKQFVSFKVSSHDVYPSVCFKSNKQEFYVLKYPTKYTGGMCKSLFKSLGIPRQIYSKHMKIIKRF